MDFFETQENIQLTYDDCKMILKGRLLKPLEHQWKQPLNVVATNLLNLELKSELSKLTSDDVSKANEKVEQALDKISNNISTLNQCFSDSSCKSEFSIVDSYLLVLEFIAHQILKYDIKTTKADTLKNIRINSYENEFCLGIFIILYIFVQSIANKEILDENYYEIEFKCEQNEIESVIISLNKSLNIEELNKSFSLELYLLKELLQKLDFQFISYIKEDKTYFKLTL